MYDVDGLRRVAAEYRHLQQSDAASAQARGRRFNELVADTLRCWGVPAETSIRTTGEVDVAFTADSIRYVMEVKWEKKPTDTGRIAKLQKRVRQRLLGTYGVFLSMSGYSAPALADIADGERLEVLLLDAGHFEAIINGTISPGELLSLARDRAAFHGRAYTPIAELQAAARPTPQPPPAPVPSSITGTSPNPTPTAPASQGHAGTAMFAFGGRRAVYWIITALGGLLTILVAILALVPPTLSASTLIGALVALVVGILTFGFAYMARNPVRLIIGPKGLQLVTRHGTTWLPWDKIRQVTIATVAGGPHVIVWTPDAASYPTLASAGGGIRPRYIPHLDALSLCPINVLQATPWQISHALHSYAGPRMSTS